MTRDYDQILRLIPGYDPFSDCGDASFDPASADFALDFIGECVHHVKGQWAGRPIDLEPWQQAIVANLWGWLRPDGSRRYRECLVYVPRKNAKTTLCAALLLLALFTDNEPGAEFYSAAGKRDQARILFGIVRDMIYREPELLKRTKLMHNSLETGRLGDVRTYTAISAEAHTAHGYNPHFAVVDELHAQPNRLLVDALATGTGSRSQPMLIYLTTADFDRPSVCNDIHRYAADLRAGLFSDPTFLPVVYEAALSDDWHSEQVWRAANPNYGVSVLPDYLAKQHRRAVQEPGFVNTFERLHLNVRTAQVDRVIPLEDWDACRVDVEDADLIGLPCFGGLDLADKDDLTAFTLVWPLSDGRFAVKAWFWCPAEGIDGQKGRQRPSYRSWLDAGWIRACPGAYIEQPLVGRDIGELAECYQIRSIGYDDKNAEWLRSHLETEYGLDMVKVTQGVAGLHEPFQALLGMIADRKIVQDGNPILRWNMGNVAVKRDSENNMAPSKKVSSQKIDGAVALTMALSRWIGQPAGEPGVYVF